MSVVLVALVLVTADGLLFGTEEWLNRLRVQQFVIFAGTAAVLISDDRRVHRIGSLVVTLAFATGLLIRFLPGVIS
jgi:hypothetical protein